MSVLGFLVWLLGGVIAFCGAGNNAPMEIPFFGDVNSEFRPATFLERKARYQQSEERDQRRLILVSSVDTAGSVQLKPNDRFDKYGVVFVNGSICFVVLMFVYAILKRF